MSEDDGDLELGARAPIPVPRNSFPAPKGKQRAEPGRLWDHLRVAEPYIAHRPFSEDAAMLREYIRGIPKSDPCSLPSVRVTHEWLEQNGPDYSQPWLAGSGNQNAENDAARLFKHRTHRKTWWQRMQRIILRNAVIPLLIRAIVLGFSAAAMVIGVFLWADSGQPTTSSIMMATIVDGIALFYLVGIIYDEYTGKPIGLRSATAKMRLIFLDLFFIVCDSANLSLALMAVAQLDPGCNNCHTGLLKSLAGVLLIALLSWILTFAISVLRYVHFIPLVSQKSCTIRTDAHHRVIERVSG